MSIKTGPVFEFPDAPEPGDFVELRPGLLWLRLPIPGALRHINVWLLEGETGWMLVDTGMRVDGVLEAWERLHASLPQLGQLEGILVTHHHPDHFGLAARLAADHAAPVFMTLRAQASARLLETERDPDTDPGLIAYAATQGLEIDGPTRTVMAGRNYQRIVSGMPADLRPLADGQELTLANAHWRVSVHDGHAPGHACLHAGDLGVLISGDQVLPTISSNVSVLPDNTSEDPLGDYLHSFTVLASLPEDTLVLPAHGRPFRGLHARIATIRAEHEDRLELLETACATPQSTLELVSVLFRLERFDALNRMLAIGETLAHLRYLECRHKLQRAGEGPGLRWRRCGILGDY